MEPQHRWVHVVAALVAIAVVVGIFFVAVPRGADGPTAQPSGAPTGTPTLSPAPSASPGATASPVVPTPVVPSITIPPLPTCLNPLAAAPLRVISFNIHGGRSHTTYDLAKIIEEVKSWNADVVVMQEVHRFRRLSGFDDQPKVLGERLGMSYVFGRTYSRAPEGPGRPARESGNLILSRLPVIESGNQALPNYRGLEPRALLHVKVQVGDQQVTVYDTHFQHTRGDIRIVQSRAVRDLISAAGGPFILGGDFNTTPDSKPLAVLAKIAVDPWPAIGTTDGLTVPARAPRRRIDFVMYGGGAWVPRQAQTVLSGVSDHRAVVLDYDLPLLDPCG